MPSKISQLIENIEKSYAELKIEYRKAMEKYGFNLKGKKIIFLKNIKDKNKALKLSIIRHITHAKLRHLLSLPFIYSMIIPALILDFFLLVYQTFAFPLYRLPKVKRRDYIVYDRRFLDYLNIIQKVHCLYCSYVNGLFAYAVEIAARTERYWCPIKAASHPKSPHSFYKEFADYGDAEGFQKTYNKADFKCFDKNL
ncbi:MAG: hypothetical protein RBS56_00975 [Candidatus Gracilibacteria bacterium]|jgi:hypothetical protein|nr:hypothetical protein [Candidatus Gracilibacteria bacterium]